MDKTTQLELGRERMATMTNRLIGSVLKRFTLPEEQQSAIYGCLGYAVASGKWDYKQQLALLLQYAPDADYYKMCQALASVGYLKRAVVNGEFEYQLSDKFVSDSCDVVASALDKAAAVCVPFQYGEVQDWELGQEYNSLNIRLVGGSSVPSATALEAVNKLQSVGFRISRNVLWLLECNAHLLNSPMMYAQYQLAKQASEIDSLQFCVTFDYRGRLYYRGGIISPQGPDWQKALFEFSVGRRLGKHGLDVLYLSAATAYGCKFSLNARIAWGMEQAEYFANQIMENNGGLVESASDPFQFAALVLEIRLVHQWMAAGNDPADYVSHVVCHADGCCNGLQHGAAITGSREIANLTNCTPTRSRDEDPQDAYRLAASNLIEQLNGNAAAQGVLVLSGRKALKYPVMVVGYGAGEDTCYSCFQAELQQDELRTVEQACKGQHVDMVYKAVGSVAHPIIALNAEMKEVVKITQEFGPCPISWETSDHFLVVQECRTKNKDKMEYIGFGEHRTRTDGICAKAQESAIGPNYVHSLDAAHCREVVREADYEVVTIHDSIGCHAAAFWRNARVIRSSFAAIYEWDQAQSFRDHNNVRFNVPELGDFSPAECASAPYFFL